MDVIATTGPREHLAQLTALAAQSVPGIAGLHRRPRSVHVTHAGGERLDGVSVVAGPGNDYDVTVCVLALPVPLHALADALRERLRSLAAEAGLTGALGRIDVQIDGVVEPGTPAP